MNERILSPQVLKLVQQVGPGYSLANPEWVKKFAQLIAEDAINTVQSVGDKASNDVPFEVTDLFVSQLRQRYGVKE